MAWDFSTEPEFQQKLDWMREFVREEIWPIETVFEDLGQEGFERAIAPLQEQVKERGLWAAHLPPDLGGQGFGQVKLGLMHEILGSSVFAPSVFGNAAPDSGNSEILAQWLQMAVAGNYAPAWPKVEEFLCSVGRRKFLKPLYTEMMKTPEGRERAIRIYAKARPGYHPIAQSTMDALIYA